MVSVANLPYSRFTRYIRSARYLLEIGRMADLTARCVVALRVSWALLSPIPHLSDSSIAVIRLCQSVDTNVRLAGISFPTWSAFMHRSRSSTRLGLIWCRIALSELGNVYPWYSIVSWEYGLSVVPMLDILEYRCIWRDDIVVLTAPSCTASGFQGWRLVISMCSHVASSSFDGILDVNESLVPWKVNGMVGPPSIWRDNSCSRS